MLSMHKNWIERPIKGERVRKQGQGQGSSRWPGLNVVTNFAKPPMLVQRATEGDVRQDRGLGLRRQGDTSSTGKGMNARLQYQRSITSPMLSTSKGRLDDLRRAASKASSLSPSDRAVVIGISVSPEEFGDHALSAGASPTAPGTSNGRRDCTDGRPPVTPTILVTPATEKTPWAEVPEEQTQRSRGRPTSSIYSQVPQYGGRFKNSSIVPPIPPLPPDSRQHIEHTKSPDGCNDKSPPSRVMSSCTVFDEEEDPMIESQWRPSSGESQLRLLTKKGSSDSIATRHRSQGWWNHIGSPFWPRSPMTFTVASPSSKYPASALPNASHTSPSAVEQPSSNRTSPQTPAQEILRSSHTSWTDESLDADCDKRGLDFDKGGRESLTGLLGEMPVPDIFSPARHEGFGAACEYFEACLYDTHSPTPYFECRNHFCIPPRPEPKEAVLVHDGNFAGPIDGNIPQNDVSAPREVVLPPNLAIQQAPKNRFSAAFHEAVGPNPKPRPVSEATVIEDLDTTPDVQEAHVAPVVRAPGPRPAVQPPLFENGPDVSREVGDPPAPVYVTPRHPPAYSPPRARRTPRRYVAVMPPDHPQRTLGQPLSPAPSTPGQRQPSRDVMPLDNMNLSSRIPPLRNHYNENYEIHGHEGRTTLADLYPPPRDTSVIQRDWDVEEKYELPSRERRARGCPKINNCFKRDKKPKKKKKWMLVALSIGLLLMVILVVVLAMTLSKKGDKVSVQSQWLNMTGYPPIPTGISTVVRPYVMEQISGCVAPSTLWSCDLPKEEQQSLSSSAPNQPNFRLEILFKNETNTAVGNASNVDKRACKGVTRNPYAYNIDPVSVVSFIRGRLLHTRDVLSSALYTPSPSPPSQEDQKFLGNATEKNTIPFDGEYTPFFITFELPTKLPSRLFKRHGSNNPDNSTDSFPDVTSAIPAPSTKPDGKAAAATLLPYPSAQPLRLYNRGQSTEYYGFYNYFDRSIFLKSTAPLNASSTNMSPNPDDEDGGAPEDAASVRCTWAQTRFLVQIWTKRGYTRSLPANPANSTSTSHSLDRSKDLNNSSANDFTPPGSFPYPVTITLDRHGGDIKRKMIYCYGIDDRGHMVSKEKKVQLEDRSYGGVLVNPALGPFGSVNVTTSEGGPGGIDGGSGGCGCKWETFG